MKVNGNGRDVASKSSRNFGRPWPRIRGGRRKEGGVKFVPFLPRAKAKRSILEERERERDLAVQRHSRSRIFHVQVGNMEARRYVFRQRNTFWPSPHILLELPEGGKKVVERQREEEEEEKLAVGWNHGQVTWRGSRVLHVCVVTAHRRGCGRHVWAYLERRLQLSCRDARRLVGRWLSGNSQPRINW